MEIKDEKGLDKKGEKNTPGGVKKYVNGLIC